jgi:SAM-dependent methyltransferase
MTRSSGDAVPPASSVSHTHFDTLYRDSGDPWHLASAWYERRKYAITVAALPRERYRSGLEPGCSIGELTRMLAARCDRLLAFDFADAAVCTARASLSGWPNVCVERLSLPAELPDGSYDLIVVSEILYYLSAADLTNTVDGLVARLDADGDLVAVHHRAIDRCYGYDGFNVHESLAERPELKEISRFDDVDFALRVFRKQAPLTALPEMVLNAVLGAKALEHVACASRALESEHRPRPVHVRGIGQDISDVLFQHIANRREDIAARPDCPIGTYVDGCVAEDARRISILEPWAARPQIAADVVQFVARELRCQSCRKSLRHCLGSGAIGPKIAQVRVPEEVQAIVREVARQVAAEPFGMVYEGVQVSSTKLVQRHGDDAGLPLQHFQARDGAIEVAAYTADVIIALVDGVERDRYVGDRRLIDLTGRAP